MEPGCLFFGHTIVAWNIDSRMTIFQLLPVCHSVHRGVSRPRPRGEVEGLAGGLSRPTPRGEVGGMAGGVSRLTPREGCVQAYNWGSVSRPTPWGGCPGLGVDPSMD